MVKQYAEAEFIFTDLEVGGQDLVTVFKFLRVAFIVQK